MVPEKKTTAKQQAVMDKKDVLEAIDSRMAKIGDDHDTIVEIRTEQRALRKELYEGNGHPAVLERIARAEEHYEEILKLEEGNGKAITQLTEDIHELTLGIGVLKQSVTDHHHEPHLYKLVWNWRFWMIIFAAIVVIAAIITVVPDLLDILLHIFSL
jgi:hypothetical protein